MTKDNKLEKIARILQEAKRLSKEYKLLTGKPLGITGEVAEFEAAKRLGLTLKEARSPGHDATKQHNGTEVLFQVKGRSYGREVSESGQRIGKIDFTKNWHVIVLVLLDEDYEVKEILQAQRTDIEERLKRLVSRADGKATHTQKGALTVPLFRSIAKKQ